MRLLLVLAVLLPGMALANPRLDRIDGLIETGDVAALSSGIAEAHALAEAEGAAALVEFWSAFDTAFYVTHPIRQGLVSDWLEAEPRSPFALSAIARLYQKRGAMRRGSFVASETPRSAWEAFAADAEKAADAARQALAQDPRMVAAYFVLLDLGMTRQIENEAFDLAPGLLEVTPSIWAVNGVVGAYSPRWGWSHHDVIAVCEAYAQRAPGYDTETCIDVAILTHYADWPGAVSARERLWSRTEPELDGIKLRDFYETGGLDPFDKSTIDWAVDQHRRQFGTTTDPVEWWMQGVQLAVRYDLPLYGAEARERAAPRIAAEEARDPFDHDRLSAQAHVEKAAGMLSDQPVPRERLAELWVRSMFYGRDNQWRWLEGLEFLPDWTDVEDMMPFVVNAIVAAPDKVTMYSAVMNHLDHVGGILRSALQTDVRTTIAGVDPATIPERVERLDCLQLRVARLLEGQCSGLNGVLNRDCTAANPGYSAALNFLQEAAGLPAMCPAVRGAALVTLEFAERMPYPPLDDLLARYPDRLD